LSALGALDRNLDTLPDTGRLGCCNGCQALIFSLFARLATLGLVAESLVVEKDLFPGRPDKVLTTIYALDRSVLVFNLGACQNFGGCFHV
jgi:hypothetical protein